MRRSAAAALAGPSLVLAAAAACQCAPDVALFDCRDASWDCGWCDRAGACVLFPDGGLVPDGGGGGACAPFAGQRICSADGVCWEHPLPQGNDLVGVWGTASSGPDASIWAVGALGTVLHYDGNAWSSVDSGTRNDLLSVWSDRRDEAWVAGASGTWSKVTLQGTVTPVGGVSFNDLTDLWGEPNGTWVWAVGYGGKVYRANRSNPPLTALELTTVNPNAALYAVFGVPGGLTVWVAGENGSVYGYSASNGIWTSTGGLLWYDAFDLWMPSSSELLVSASDGGVYSSNGIGAWSLQPLAPPLGDIPAAIWGSAATSELWVRGYDGLSYYRSPSLTWSSAPDPSRLNFRDVWGDSQATWSVGEKGYIGTWNASGARWDARSTAVFPPRPVDADVLALQRVGCEAWAGGRNGQLLHRTDAGWSERLRAPAPITALWAPSSAPQLWYAFGDAGQVGRIIGAGAPVEASTGLGSAVAGLSGLGPSAIWAVGEDGGIAYWDGMGWARQANPQRANLNAVLALAPDDVWAAGNTQTVLHFNGSAWITFTAPGSGLDLRAIAASGSKVFFAGGTTIFTYDRDAGWSSRSDVPRPISALAADDQGRLWAAGAKGALGYVPLDGSAFQSLEALAASDFHALSFLGGELVVAGDRNAILDVRTGP